MKFMNKLNEIYQNNKKIKIFVDMDGTIVECLFDKDDSYKKEGAYLKKEPIIPVMEQIDKIDKSFKNVEINILSCSRDEKMSKEKNEWIDKNIPYIKEDNRIFLEKKGPTEDRNKVKGEYIKNHILQDELAILIDDDRNVLSEAQKIVGDSIIPIHVTSLII